MGVDGSIYVGVFTLGVFGGDVSAGGTDLAAVKLDNDGKELWRWQVGENVLLQSGRSNIAHPLRSIESAELTVSAGMCSLGSGGHGRE